MSIHYISQAWKTPVADYKAKLVLLKLADNANDEGIAWPHIDTIATETGLSRRGVFRALNQLEEDKLIERNRGRNEVIYKIHKCQADTSTSAKLAPLEVEKCQADTSRSAKLALTLTKEPSREHTGEEEEKPQRFQKPTIHEVHAYGMTLSPRFLKADQFINYYESKGWVIGKSPMKSWKAAVRTWQAKDKPVGKPQTSDQFGI
jgi:DNA-binding transcriptional regulator YhcF (GntR family)